MIFKTKQNAREREFVFIKMGWLDGYSKLYISTWTGEFINITISLSELAGIVFLNYYYWRNTFN